MARLALVLAALSLLAVAQDSTPATRAEPTPDAVADALLSTSLTRRQSALVKAKAEPAVVVPLLVARLDAPSSDALVFDAVRGLGALPHPDLTQALIRLHARPSFPWKPQIVEALADHASAEARAVFVAATASPVWRSRQGAARGLAAIGAKEQIQLLQKLLADEEGVVRVEAATALHRLGSFAGLPVLARDLTLDRRFGDTDHGKVVREAALKSLVAMLPRSFGENPPADPLALVASPLAEAKVAALYRELRQSSPEPDALPTDIQPHDPDAGADCTQLVEVRSCQEGDLYVRLAAGGRVVFGRDQTRAFDLAVEEIAPLVQALAALDTGGKPRKILGPVTCDFERLAVLEKGGWRALVIGTGKRPAALDAFEAALQAVIARTLGAEAAAAQVRRIRPFGAPAPAESRGK